jgi:hypothetical protein
MGAMSPAHPAFLALGKREADAWREKIPPSRAKEGQILFYKGHFPYGAYVLHSGILELLPNGGAAHPPRLVKAPAILGLWAVHQGEPHPATAIVRRTAVYSFVDKRWLSRLIAERDPLLPAVA